MWRNNNISRFPPPEAEASSSFTVFLGYNLHEEKICFCRFLPFEQSSSFLVPTRLISNSSEVAQQWHSEDFYLSNNLFPSQFLQVLSILVKTNLSHLYSNIY